VTHELLHESTAAAAFQQHATECLGERFLLTKGKSRLQDHASAAQYQPPLLHKRVAL
jgi:hypothetical protein